MTMTITQYFGPGNIGIPIVQLTTVDVESDIGEERVFGRGLHVFELCIDIGLDVAPILVGILIDVSSFRGVDFFSVLRDVSANWCGNMVSPPIVPLGTNLSARQHIWPPFRDYTLPRSPHRQALSLLSPQSVGPLLRVAVGNVHQD